MEPVRLSRRDRLLTGTALRWEYPPGAAGADLYERMGTLLSIEGCGEEPTEWFEKSRAEVRTGRRWGRGVARPAATCRPILGRRAHVRELHRCSTAASAAAVLARPAISAEADCSLARYAITLGDPALALEHLACADAMRAHFDPVLRACYHEVEGGDHAALGARKTRCAIAVALRKSRTKRIPENSSRKSRTTTLSSRSTSANSIWRSSATRSRSRKRAARR